MERILMITPDGHGVHPLVESLERSGFAQVETITDSRKALPAYRQLKPGVVVMDGDLDQLGAMSVMKQLTARGSKDEILPFIVLSSSADPALKRSYLDAGLTPFFQDPSKPEDFEILVEELVTIRNTNARLNAAFHHALAEQRQAEEAVARYLAQVAEFKDHPRSGHPARVGHLSALIALVLGMTREEVEMMRLAAPLHDVGKVGIPEAILFKEEPITLEELDLIKTHTTIGASILAGSASRLFQMAEEIALYHHENWDGTGYTPGLEGESIPLVGRIVRVADTFDASTSARPFADRWRREAAVSFIREQAGRGFDPAVVEAFLEVQAEAQESGKEMA
jgi:putative two-component system response regulator